MNHDLIDDDGEYKTLGKRKITLETTKRWGYQVGKFKGKPVQIANYKDDGGDIVAQKIRFPNKDFFVHWGHQGGWPLWQASLA